MPMSDTIFAQASARGKSGVAIIRMSGPKAWDVARQLTGPLPAPRTTSLRKLVDPKLGFLDQALVLCFAADASFTGEPVVELHLHGSLATVSAVLSALGAKSGTRLAEPGEFTRRALENGCLDLTQVEGLGDLLEAETESQRKQALNVLSGALGDKAESWRRDLIRAVALLEATIDFADEEVPVDVVPEVRELVSRTRSDLLKEISGSVISERIRDGFEVAIVGPPNVGKSTLLNRLAGREAAITSEIAGTTRDVIEVRMDLAGLPVTFLDTAGLRDTEDVIEGLGIKRAKDRASRADLRVFLQSDPGSVGFENLQQEDDIFLVGKADLVGENDFNAVSGISGLGIDNLIERITNTLGNRTAGSSTATRERHRGAMERAVVGLDQGLLILEQSDGLDEIASEHLNQAVRALDSLVGKVDVENILDEIFTSFCLGK